MSHEVETIAYANAVPWHGLGNNVDPNSSVEEMLVAAGLNWKLDAYPIQAVTPAGALDVPNRQAWVRDSDQKVMAVSSDSWRPLQPADTLEFMRNYVDAGAATLETAGSLRGGRVVWGLARLKHDFEVTSGDRVNGYVLITSPNVVGQAITVRTTTVRVVCANTMALAEQGAAAYRQGHNYAFDVDAAKAAIGQAHESLYRAEQSAKTIAKLKLNPFDAIVEVWAPVFAPDISKDEVRYAANHGLKLLPKSLTDIIASYYQAPGADVGTGWGALNAVTHYADHKSGRTNAGRMYRSWMGDLASKKLEVEQRLLELV
jgi:phage/plasmid-like protein (TIGR03299 family)